MYGQEKKSRMYRLHWISIWLSLISLWNFFIVQHFFKREVIFHISVLSCLHTQHIRMISVWFVFVAAVFLILKGFIPWKEGFLSAFRNNSFDVTTFKRNLKFPLSNYVFIFVKYTTGIHLLYEELGLPLICEIHRVVPLIWNILPINRKSTVFFKKNFSCLIMSQLQVHGLFLGKCTWFLIWVYILQLLKIIILFSIA